METLSVTVADGKYTVLQDEFGRLSALRYGRQWRDCVGDGLILALAQEVERLWKEFEELSQAKRESEKDLIEGLDKEDDKVCQLLAQAIGGYPWYKDDPANFPAATEADGVCYGDHVPVTLAQEVAKEIRRLRTEPLLADLADQSQAEENYQKLLEAEKVIAELRKEVQELKAVCKFYQNGGAEL